MRRIVFKNR